MAVGNGEMLFDPPENANEAFFDAMVRHQVYLMRYSGSVRNRINRILNATEADLVRQIKEKLDRGRPTPQRQQLILDVLTNTRRKAWAEVNEAWAEELVALSQAEPEFLAGIVATVSPVVVDTTLPAPRLLKAIATARPFQGRILKQWAANIEAEDIRRIHNEVQMGMTAGETSQQIARRVVGSAKLQGVDGTTQITRNQAAAITRTAVNHIANRARNEFMQENSDLFEFEQYVATLDARTTPVCRAEDGEVYEIGTGPIPPLHFNCRSLRVAALNPEYMMDRPARPHTERMLLREYASKNNLSTVPKTRAGLPHGTKGDFDAFKRKRVRELTGRVPAKTSYQEWLGKQSQEFQNDTLGLTKAKLFQEGGLPLKRFVNRKGDELNLRTLAKNEASAFRAAGLDPADYL